MIALIDEAKKDGDTLGGVCEVVCRGLPVGLGSHVSWDRKLDARIGAAMMSIPAVKGVGIGIGFEAAQAVAAQQVHDEIHAASGKRRVRRHRAHDESRGRTRRRHDEWRAAHRARRDEADQHPHATARNRRDENWRSGRRRRRAKRRHRGSRDGRHRRGDARVRRRAGGDRKVRRRFTAAKRSATIGGISRRDDRGCGVEAWTA